MDELLLHACCGPCSTVAVPAWRDQGYDPVALFANANIQPDTEVERRLESMLVYGRDAGVEVVLPRRRAQAEAWREWAASQVSAAPEERCRACLSLRMRAAAAAAADLGVKRFSTTLTVSPYQRHDLILSAGREAAKAHGVEFLYADLRAEYRTSYDESRRLGLYRQAYCGCAASKWERWHEKAARRRPG